MTTRMTGDQGEGGGKPVGQDVLPTTTMQYETFNGDGAEAAVLKKGKWTEEEDEKLRRAVVEYGVENWVAIEKYSGLARQSKSCRLRWINHLRPNLKKGPFTEEEERIIVKLHFKYGNRWSRIASKLRGRTDNEIKNFWHKRVKKCRKHHRPIYPAYTEEDPIPAYIPKGNIEYHHTAVETNVDNECWLDDPDYMMQSHSIHLPDQSLFSLHYLPNTAMNYLTDHASISASTNSPRISISSPHDEQQYFKISHLESPTDCPTQTCYPPDAPLQSLNQSTDAQFSTLVETSSPIQVSSLLQQGVAGTNALATFRNPLILSSSKGQFGRFHRATSRLSLLGHSIDSMSSSSALNSSPIKRPKSPLKLQLSTHESTMSAPQVSTSVATSPVPPLNVGSPTLVTSPPLSPLKFHSSQAAPSDLYAQSNFSNPESPWQLNALTAAPLHSSLHFKPVPLGRDLQPIQPSPSRSFQTSLNSSFTAKTEPPSIQISPSAEHDLYKLETDNNLEALDMLKETQAKARFRRKNLRLSRIPHKRIFLEGISRKEGFFSASTEANDMLDGPFDRDSYESLTRECLPSSSSRTSKERESLWVNASSKNSKTKDPFKIISRKNSVSSDPSKTRVLIVERATQENVLCKVLQSQNPPSENYMLEVLSSQNPKTEELTLDKSSETKTKMGESLQIQMYSVAENMTFQEQRHKVDLLDLANSKSNTNTALHPIQIPAGESLCEFPSREDSSGKNSQILYLQDSFLMGDLFGQSSVTDQVQDLDAFVPLFSQSTATTLIKSSDKCGQLSFLEKNGDDYFGSGFKTEFTDSLERKITEEHNLEGDSKKLELHESNLLYQQYPSSNLTESGCMVTELSIESELQEGT